VAADDLASLLASALAFVALALAARAAASQRAGSRVAWTLVAITMGLVVVGNAIYALLEVVLHQPPTPSLADVCDAAAYPFFFAAILLLPTERPPARALLRTFVDTAIVMLAAGCLWWILGIAPQLAHTPSGTPLANVNLVYPVVDLAVVWALFVSLARKFDPRDRLPAGVLYAGVAIEVVRDVAFSFQLLNGQPATGGITDIGSTCFMLLLGLAGWIRLTGRQGGARAAAPPKRILDPPAAFDYAPYAAAVVAYILLVTARDRVPFIGFTATAIGLGSITGLLLLRQWLASREIADLNVSLQASREIADLNGRLAASEARYRAMVECQADLIARWHPDGTLTYANDVLVRYLGRGRDEVLRRGMLSPLSAEERDLLQASLAITSPRSPIFVTQTCLQAPGREQRYVEWTHLALFEGGKIVEMQSVGRDVTDRERARRTLERWNEDLEQRVEARTAELVAEVAERTSAQERLQRYAAKLEASNRELQEFAYVSSHDLQEPLRKIQAFGDRLRDRCGGALDEPGLDYLGRMQAAAARMQGLIDGLLAYSRVTSKAQPFVAVDLCCVTRGVLADLEARVAEVQGQVEVGLLPSIAADPLQMRQLIQNLLSNALKFHREGVAPIVRISGALLEAPAVRAAEDEPKREWCELRVEDNGIGFDEKYIDRIFQVFQRLHGRGVYEGAGIGLAVCRKVAERHGGSITAHSTPGQGSVFVVTLPVSHAADPAGL